MRGDPHNGLPWSLRRFLNGENKAENDTRGRRPSPRPSRLGVGAPCRVPATDRCPRWGRSAVGEVGVFLVCTRSRSVHIVVNRAPLTSFLGRLRVGPGLRGGLLLV